MEVGRQGKQRGDLLLAPPTGAVMTSLQRRPPSSGHDRLADSRSLDEGVHSVGERLVGDVTVGDGESVPTGRRVGTRDVGLDGVGAPAELVPGARANQNHCRFGESATGREAPGDIAHIGARGRLERPRPGRRDVLHP